MTSKKQRIFMAERDTGRSDLRSMLESISLIGTIVSGMVIFKHSTAPSGQMQLQQTN